MRLLGDQPSKWLTNLISGLMRLLGEAFSISTIHKWSHFSLNQTLKLITSCVNIANKKTRRLLNT